MKVGPIYHYLGLYKLLQPLVEQLAIIDIWHCQYVTTVPYIPLLALRYFDLRWLHTTISDIEPIILSKVAHYSQIILNSEHDVCSIKFVCSIKMM